MRWWSHSLVVVALLTCARAQADDPQLKKARALFKKAEVRFSLGEFQKALKLYKEAYRTKRLPEFLFNIGQCHRHAGNCKEAVFHFQQFLLHQPNAAEKSEVQRLIRKCAAKLALEQKAQGVAMADHTHTQRDPPVSRIWFWVGVGVTAALLTTGMVTGVLARKTSDRDEGEALDVTSIITTSMGAAAVGGTVALWFLSTPGSETVSVLSVAPSRGGGLVQLQGRF
jgi:tetratricopeptide (TPR) repeat protein